MCPALLQILNSRISRSSVGNVSSRVRMDSQHQVFLLTHKTGTVVDRQCSSIGCRTILLRVALASIPLSGAGSRYSIFAGIKMSKIRNWPNALQIIVQSWWLPCVRNKRYVKYFLRTLRRFFISTGPWTSFINLVGSTSWLRGVANVRW